MSVCRYMEAYVLVCRSIQRYTGCTSWLIKWLEEPYTCTNPKENMGSVFPYLYKPKGELGSVFPYLYKPKGEHGVCVPIPVQTQRGTWGLCSHTCTNPKGSMGSVFPYLYKPKGEHGICVPIPVQTQRGTWGLCSHKMMCTTWPSNRLSWRGRCSCS